MNWCSSMSVKLSIVVGCCCNINRLSFAEVLHPMTGWV